MANVFFNTVLASRSLGYDVIQRTNLDEITNIIIIPDPTQHISSDVLLQSWQVYVKVTSIQHHVFLQIWRPLEAAQEYTLVTETLFEPEALRFNELPVQSNVMLQTGDVIGFYFPTHNPIPYSVVPCASREQFVGVVLHPSAPPTAGATHTFSVLTQTPHRCRHYSINAQLGE